MRQGLLPLLLIALARTTTAAQPSASTNAPATANGAAPDVTSGAAPKVADDPRAHAAQLTTLPAVSDDREGVVVGASFGLGTGVTGDVRLGWMLHPRIAVFATAVGSTSTHDAGSDFRLLGIGARLWIAGPVFLDGRVGHAQATHHDIEAPAMRYTTGVGYLAGLGVELVGLKTFGLELNAEFMKGGESGALVVGLGVTFY